MEEEVDNKIPFLDVQVEKTEEAFRTSVYRKPTATDRYLNYQSHHADTVKKGIVRCLQNRAINISADEETRKREMTRLTDIFRRNGYTTGFVTHKPRDRSQQQPRDQPIATVSLPYNRGLSEKLRRICGRYNIRVVFRSTTTLRRSLTKIRPTTTKEQTKNCIYDIPCSCGRSYKGETGRPLAVRLEEHRKATIRGETLKPGVAEHDWSDGGHRPAWQETTIIKKEPHWKIRKIKEAAHMALTSNPISKPSVDISPVWLLLRKSQKCPGDK